jgi:hypothetical protein
MIKGENEEDRKGRMKEERNRRPEMELPFKGSQNHPNSEGRNTLNNSLHTH